MYEKFLSIGLRVTLRVALHAGGAIVASALIQGCRSEETSTGNSNTNWLRTCEVDADCGGLSCLCGTCSLPCATTDACGALGPLAKCAPETARAAECTTGPAPAQSLCLPACTAENCSGGRRCLDGTCVRPTSAASGGAGGAGSGGAESRGTGGAAGGSGGARAGGVGGAVDGGTRTVVRDASSERSDAEFDAAAPCAGGCGAGNVCVEFQVIGGAALYHPNDAGVCPAPYVLVPEGNPEMCWNPPSFQCEELPSGCGATPDCGCAQVLCAGGGIECTNASSAHVRCLSRVP